LLSQLFGAVVRAAIVIVIVATPSLLLPGTTPEGAQLTMLLALVLGVVVAFEYAATAPALIEFRDAPPVNRIRLLSLVLTLICLSTVASYDGSSTTGLVLNALGLLVGRALDFDFSPLRLLLDQVPDGASETVLVQARIMAGLAVFILLTTCCVFALLIRLQQWPNRGMAFNVWINLPTFDPTTGPDVVICLVRDGRINILLGFITPFVVPFLGVTVLDYLGVDPFGSSHVMVWGIALWMFLPLSLFMRGLAMIRVAEMIRTRRARMVADLDVDAPRQLA